MRVKIKKRPSTYSKFFDDIDCKYLQAPVPTTKVTSANIYIIVTFLKVSLISCIPRIVPLVNYAVQGPCSSEKSCLIDC